MTKTQKKEVQELVEKPSIVLIDEPMKNHTTFKIGGNAECFVRVASVETLRKVLSYARKNKIETTIIGNGSNILVLDKGIEGITIQINIQKYEINSNTMVVGAGNKLTAVAYKAYEESLSGLEELAGIPRNNRWSNLHECRGTRQRNERHCYKGKIFRR